MQSIPVSVIDYLKQDISSPLFELLSSQVIKNQQMDPLHREDLLIKRRRSPIVERSPEPSKHPRDVFKLGAVLRRGPAVDQRFAQSRLTAANPSSHEEPLRVGRSPTIELGEVLNPRSLEIVKGDRELSFTERGIPSPQLRPELVPPVAAVYFRELRFDTC